MRAVAVCMTYGRALACELLACWARQTRPVPMLLWVDSAPHLEVRPPPGVVVVHGSHPDPRGLGGLRALATSAAITRFGLRAHDVVMVLDDDDFYTGQHADITLVPFADEACHWVAGLAMGLQHAPGELPEYVAGESGVGQHGTWAYRVGLYLDAGGYIERDVGEDPSLAGRMGWQHCRTHSIVTHVRRHHGHNISGPHVRHWRKAMGAKAGEAMADVLTPRWSDECEKFDRWCAVQNGRRLIPPGEAAPPSSGP